MRQLLARIPRDLVASFAAVWVAAEVYAIYWYTRVPRESYPSLEIRGKEELPLLLHVTSAMAAVCLFAVPLWWGLLRVRRWAKLGSGIALGVCASLLLLPALSGQHHLLVQYRWPLVGATLVLACLSGVFLVRWLDRDPELAPAWFGNPTVRRIALRVVAALALGVWWIVTEPLRLYPALLFFSFSSAVLSFTASFEPRSFGAHPSKRDRVLLGATVAGILLGTASLGWIGDAQSFARVRYVFSRRCIGADALVRLDESFRSEWLKTKAALVPTSRAKGRAKAWPSPLPEPRSRPHVVLFVIDALRYDQVFDPHGASPAPNLVELSSRGRSFERAYSASSGTAQSMMACLSGLPPGVLARLEVVPPTLPAALGELGYRTATAWDLTTLRMDGTFPMLRGQGIAALGFQSRHEPRGSNALERDRAQVENALERLGQADLPRLEYLHLMHTHGPFPGERGDENYRAAVAKADKELGRFVSGLRERGLDDETLILVFGDHGEALGEHGQTGHNQTLYVEETHVPLVVVGPAIEVGVDPEPVSLMEVPWLVLDAMGLPWPHGSRGGRDAPHGKEGAVLLEYKMLDEVTQRGLRSRERTLYQHKLEGRSELYDLAVDPAERSLVQAPAELQRWVDLENRVGSWESHVVEQIEALPRQR